MSYIDIIWFQDKVLKNCENLNSDCLQIQIFVFNLLSVLIEICI